MNIIFLEPIFKDRIWGGTKLKEVFGYSIKGDHVGECWAISAHKNGANTIKNGKYEGLTLDELYRFYKSELFNNDPSETFPILVKILDANDDLSIQVHPDDAYALEHENDFGKTECWYVIDAKNNAKIIDGHHAASKIEFVKRIEENDLSLWKYRAIKKDDFISIPAKKVHAIGSGILIYEVQQSSDTTYRIYDYNRISADGTKRELHINQALHVIDIPSKEDVLDIKKTKTASYELYEYIKNEYFELRRVDVKKTYTFSTKQYQLFSVLEGHGHIDETPIKKGDHFIVLGSELEKNITIKGDLKLMITKRPNL